MKKKLVMGMIMMMLAAETMTAAGCGSSKAEVVTSTETKAEAEKTSEHQVTLYDSDGTTVLDQLEVADGEQLEETIPGKEVYRFAGWFQTPEMIRACGFTKAVTYDGNG